MSPAKSSAKRGASVPAEDVLNASDRDVTREPENDQLSDDQSSDNRSSDDSNTMRGDADGNADGDRSNDDMDERIRQRAYEIYCLRRDGSGGYEAADGGNDLNDWFTAEREFRNMDIASEPTVSRLNAPTQGTPPTIFEQLSENGSSTVRGF